MTNHHEVCDGRDNVVFSQEAPVIDWSTVQFSTNAATGKKGGKVKRHRLFCVSVFCKLSLPLFLACVFFALMFMVNDDFAADMRAATRAGRSEEDRIVSRLCAYSACELGAHSAQCTRTQHGRRAHSHIHTHAFAAARLPLLCECRTVLPPTRMSPPTHPLGPIPCAQFESMDMVLQTTGALMSTNDTIGQQYTNRAVARARNLLERNYDIYAGRDGLKPIRSVGGILVRAAIRATALWIAALCGYEAPAQPPPPY